MPRVLSVALLAVFATTLPAQDAERVKDALAQFHNERTEAARSFPAPELTPADELAARAEAALKEGNSTAAARYARAARWQLPFRPANLPEHVSRVFGVSRLRHADRVNALSYSPDGSRLASASRDGTVRIWNLDNGREVRIYRGHADQGEKQTENTNVFRVPAVAYSPDGELVASSGGKDIHIWNVATGKLLHKLSAHKAPPRGLAWAPDGKTLASGGDDRKVIIWDVVKEKPAHVFPDQAQRVEAAAVNGNGKLLATINAAGELYVYAMAGEHKTLLTVSATKDGQIGFGVAFAGANGIVTCGGDNTAKLIASPDPSGTTNGTGTIIRSYIGHAEKLNDLDVTRDGKLLVTGSRDNSVRVWDVATGKALFTFQGPPGTAISANERETGVTAVAVSPDGKYVAAGSVDGSIRLWPLSASDEHRVFTEATDALWTVAVSPDGKRFAAAGADRSIRVYDTATGKLQKTLTGHKGAIPCVVFVGNTALASASGDRLVKVWDLANGTATDCVGHTAAVLAVATDDAGKLLVSGSVDKSVRGWEPGSGKNLWTWTGKSAVCAVVVCKDGQRIAVGTADGWLTILALAGSAPPRVVGAIAAHRAGVAGVAFHPDGNRLATCGGDGVVRIWALPDAGAPTLVAKFDPPVKAGSSTSLTPITAVAYSADGQLIAFAGADAITRVWNAQTGNEVRGFRGHTDWVTAVAFTPDGRSILSAGVDKAVRQFDLPRQESLAAAGHTQPVRCVAVSRDGKLLATGSADRTIKVWDLTTGRPVATLIGSGGSINAMGFAGPNTVAAGGDDDKVRWWTVRPTKELRAVPAGLVFNLAVAPNSERVTAAWIRTDEKQAGFNVFGANGAIVSQVTETGRNLTCAALAPDGTLAVSGGDDGIVRVWNLTTKKRIGDDWPLLSQTVADLGLTPDKKTLVAIDVDGTVKIADLTKREAATTIKAVSGSVIALVVAPTGDKFATLAADGTVKAWSLKGAELRAWKLPVPPAAAAFSPDGKTLITGNKDGTAYVLDLP